MVNTSVKSEETEATELNNLVKATQLINARAKAENKQNALESWVLTITATLLATASLLGSARAERLESPLNLATEKSFITWTLPWSWRKPLFVG